MNWDNEILFDRNRKKIFFLTLPIRKVCYKLKFFHAFLLKSLFSKFLLYIWKFTLDITHIVRILRYLTRVQKWQKIGAILVTIKDVCTFNQNSKVTDLFCIIYSTVMNYCKKLKNGRFEPQIWSHRVYINTYYVSFLLTTFRIYRAPVRFQIV